MNLSTASSPSTDKNRPDAISRRAYEIWEREGCPEGCDLRHWLQAEQELSQENAETAGESNGSQGNGRSASGLNSANSDVTPLQGTRAAAAVGRDARRGATGGDKSKRKGAGATL